jgi:hypothetical protein
MIYYITRSCGSCILFGGLERVHVWCSRPTLYIQRNYSEIYDAYKNHHLSDLDSGLSVFARGYSDFPSYLRRKGEWSVSHESSSMQVHKTPFNKIFGYSDGEDIFDNSIATAVWNEIEKDFNYEPFDDWDVIDRCEKSVYGEYKFMLKLTINHKGFELENISEDSESYSYDSESYSYDSESYLPF